MSLAVWISINAALLLLCLLVYKILKISIERLDRKKFLLAAKEKRVESLHLDIVKKSVRQNAFKYIDLPARRTWESPPPVPLLLLRLTGAAHEVVTVAQSDLEALRSVIAFPQLPLLLVDENKILGQTSAICRYIGREHSMFGTNSKEAMQVDEYVEEFFASFRGIPIFSCASGDVVSDSHWGVLKRFVARTNDRLSPNHKKSPSEFLVGSNFSLADFLVVYTYELLRRMDASVAEMYPRIEELSDTDEGRFMRKEMCGRRIENSSTTSVCQDM